MFAAKPPSKPKAAPADKPSEPAPAPAAAEAEPPSQGGKKRRAVPRQRRPCHTP